MTTRVQRKLEFQVRKSTRSTSKSLATQKTESPNILAVKAVTESPRKRTNNENKLVTECSPTKQKKENRNDYLQATRKGETPIRGKSQAKLHYDGPGSNAKIDPISSPLKTPLSPRKDNPQFTSILKVVPLSPRRNENLTKISSPLKVVPLSPRRPTRSENSPRKDTPGLRLKRQDGQAYHRAKQMFHTSKPERIVGREDETTEVMEFVKGHLTNKTAGSIYISGAPGTGKTAVLTHVLDNMQKSYSCKTVYLNCMTLKDAATVYGKLYSDLTGKSPPSAKDRLRAVEKCLASGPNVIIVLDEIDQLDSKNQEILYTIFEWPSMPKSRLVLLGIANALDLTDRILPRLQARPKCKPKLLNFAPYTKDQIAAILKDRLQKLENEGVVVMDSSAVQFCARKISAVAGDMRKALDVCRRAVEVVETEVRSQQVLKTNTSCNSPTKQPPTILKKIGVLQVSNVLSEVYGSSTVTSGQDSVPIQQKLVVCTLLLMVRQGRAKEVTLGKLHDSYSKVCKKRQMMAMDYSEYQSVCTLLETRGILQIKKPKDGRMAKVSLKLNEKELEHTLKDKVLISTILQEGLS